MRFPMVLMLTFFLISSTSALAADETNREIARTFANFYIQQKDLQSGWSVLRNHLDADPADAGGWNLLGLIYLEANQPSYALKAFYRAVEKGSSKDPERAIYLYNYADAAIRAGNESQARDLLTEAAAHSATGASAKLALSELKSGSSLPVLSLESASPWSGAATLFSGYDTNVLLFSDSTLSGETASGTESPAFSTILQARHSRSLAGQPLESAIMSGFTYYQAAEARKFNSLATSLSADWGANNDEFALFDGSLGTQLDLSFMNTNGFQFFNWSETLRWRGKLRHSLRAETELLVPVSYQKFRAEEGDDPVDDRTGFGIAPVLTHSRKWGAAQLSLGFRLEAQVPKGDNYRSLSLAVPLVLSRGLGSGWQTSASLEPQVTNYLRSATARRDRTIKVGLGIARPLTSVMTVSLDYSFRRNLSNVELATYSRHSLMLMVSYELF